MTAEAKELAALVENGGSARSEPSRNGSKADDERERYTLKFEGEEGKAKKLVLPPIPETPSERFRWLTCATGRDPLHPFKSARWLGNRGPDGTVLLDRLNASSTRFEPAKHINTPMRLVEALTWQSIPSDGEVPALKGEHCKKIAHVVAQLCDNSARLDAEDETRAIVDTFLHDAEPIVGQTTRGTSAQRYEAALALQRPVDISTRQPMIPRYLVDHGEAGEVTDNPEIAIRVKDLLEVTRRMVGTKPWAWLNGRMEEIGWERVGLDGHATAGRAGRQGPHARCDVYRGRR